jgi:hypothetical protein
MNGKLALIQMYCWGRRAFDSFILSSTAPMKKSSNDQGLIGNNPTIKDKTNL